VSCYQNATGIELLDDYCFVIHNQGSEDFLHDMIVVLTICSWFLHGTHACPVDHTFNHCYIFYSTFVSQTLDKNVLLYVEWHGMIVC
jgi:hypothetical protein